MSAGPCPTCPHGKGFHCTQCYPQVKPFTPPEGFVEVPRAVFLAAMGPLDVHPWPHKRDGVWRSDWKTREHRLVGVSHPAAFPESYYLAPHLAPSEYTK